MDYESGVTQITDKTVSIHHYSGAWMSQEELMIITVERKLKKIVGKRCAFWVRCRLYNIYNLAKKLHIIKSNN